MIVVRGEKWIFDPAGFLISPKDPQAYEPCWCFSGKKYRFCHMRRHLETPRSKEEEIADWERANNLKICLHPESPNMCSRNIVAAHAIQRKGGGLKSIARNGKVYGYKHHLMFIAKNNARMIPELIGINEASTFYGFCDIHDRELFQTVEANPFISSNEQIMLLSYRVIARQYYSDSCALRQVPIIVDDRGKPSHLQRALFVMAERYRVEYENSFIRHEAIKDIYGTQIMNRSFPINALTVKLEGNIEFLFSGLLYSDYDFSGNIVHNAIPAVPLCYFNIADGNGSIVVFSWIGKNRAAEEVCTSLLALNENEQASALTRYAFEYTDNIYFSPDWWEGLLTEQREKIIDRISAKENPFYIPTSNVLLEDGNIVSKAQVISCSKIGEW